MIDPTFWQSETAERLTLEQRYLFIGLFSNADDQGRLLADADFIRAAIYFRDDINPSIIERDLERIADIGSILLYEKQGHRCLQLVNWWTYQHPPTARPSRWPAPDNWQDRLCYVQNGQRIIENWQGEIWEWGPSAWQRTRNEIFDRDGGFCRYCGAPAEHVDHIMPRCQGGTDDHDNLVAACAACNLHKHARTPEQAGMVIRNG